MNAYTGASPIIASGTSPRKLRIGPPTPNTFRQAPCMSHGLVTMRLPLQGGFAAFFQEELKLLEQAEKVVADEVQIAPQLQQVSLQPAGMTELSLIFGVFIIL